MSKNIALIIAGVIFLIVSILHLIRLVMKLRVTIGQTEVPMNMSIISFIAGLIFSVWMFMAALLK